jgi:hypothetical protein
MTRQHVLDLGSALDRLRHSLEYEPGGVVGCRAWREVTQTMAAIERETTKRRDDPAVPELL